MKDSVDMMNKYGFNIDERITLPIILMAKLKVIQLNNTVIQISMNVGTIIFVMALSLNF